MKMAETPFFSQLASVNPALSARLQESAAFLAAPAATRLSEEQRALILGIARRLVEGVADLLGGAIDSRALWEDWAAQGLPGAGQLSGLCFARAEEHRWRGQPAQDVGDVVPPRVIAADAEIDIPAAAGDPPSAIDRAYLALQIADRRRFDALGHPRVAIEDLGTDLLRALLLDIAAWALVQAGKDGGEAARLGEAVRGALAQHRPDRGIDRAAADYHAALGGAGTLADSAATAIARHDWPSFVALAAATQKYRYDTMALALITAEPAQLAPMLAPLLRNQAALVPLEASLAMLPGRATASAGPDDYTAALQARAALVGEPEAGA